MKIQRHLFPALCVAGLVSWHTSSAFGQSYGNQDSRLGQIAKPEMAVNYTTGQFFSQAERDLAARVRDHFQTDPVIAPLQRNLDISVEVGTVTLQGSLPTPTEKERAIAIAERVIGVERVRDNIRVTSMASTPEVTREARETTASTAGSAYSTRGAVVPRQPQTSFPATGHSGPAAVNDPALIGSGQMAEEDRTGSTGPSDSRNTSPTTSGAVDAIGRIAKPAGDYAVTEVDRGLASQIRVALSGPSGHRVTEDNVHLVVDNGYVTIEGWVPSEQDRLAITNRVSRINGVQGINNQLRVGSSAGVIGQR